MSYLPPAELRAAARLITVTCPDCGGEGKVFWLAEARKFGVTLDHFPTCVTRRRARSRRACEADLTDALSVPLHLAHYAVCGPLVAVRHRLARV